MAGDKIEKLRDFPSVEELLQSDQLRKALELVPRPLAAEVVKESVAIAKTRFSQSRRPLSLASLFDDICTALGGLHRLHIRRVVNAAGIVVHTNLGRAPLSDELFDAIRRTVVGYGNIEFDLQSGSRGKRGVACERYLATLSGAESATVVNNCAAALFVILNTLANRRKVVISRGELVQIGGGFRIPDILKRSGARLAEVGTTNITTIDDYQAGVVNGAALILKVHKSNFVQGGFTQEVPLKQVVALGQAHDIPVINDLGSGVFIPTKDLLGYAEPTVQQSVRSGADLTCFSGDKLLGGMQAGLIVGQERFVAKIKKNPIFRTIRVDKVVYSVLERLFEIYLNGTHATDIKLWSILSTPVKTLEERAVFVLERAGNPSSVTARQTKAFVGGGALPESAIPSIGLIFSKDLKPNPLIKMFRDLDPPIIGRIEDDSFVLDLKAVETDDLAYLGTSIRHVLDRVGQDTTS
jgi:L-seryl-tRNA(Ser) seleniumtransferase